MNLKNDKKKSFQAKTSKLLIIISCVLFFTLLLIIDSPGLFNFRKIPPGVLCGTNLSGLGKAMLVYASDYNGKYPIADQWCDLLIIYSEVDPKALVCKGSDAKINESSYAINTNIAGKKPTNFSPDTVLLFETISGKNSLGRDEESKNRRWYQILSERTGQKNPRRINKVKGSDEIYKDRWNQTGGQEILSTENHDGQGCFILFNDGQVAFIKKENLGELKWE